MMYMLEQYDPSNAVLLTSRSNMHAVILWSANGQWWISIVFWQDLTKTDQTSFELSFSNAVISNWAQLIEFIDFPCLKQIANKFLQLRHEPSFIRTCRIFVCVEVARLFYCLKQAQQAPRSFFLYNAEEKDQLSCHITVIEAVAWQKLANKETVFLLGCV